MPQPKREVQRDKRLTVFLTEEDHRMLSNVAGCCGLKSPGALATYLLESSLNHGFNKIMAVKTAGQIQAKLEEAKWPIEMNFRSLLDKAPLLPEPDLDAEALEEVRKSITEEIRLKKQKEKEERKRNGKKK